MKDREYNDMCLLANNSFVILLLFIELVFIQRLFLSGLLMRGGAAGKLGGDRARNRERGWSLLSHRVDTKSS